MLKKIKDKTLSFGVKQAINFKIKEVGEILWLNLDTQNKKIEAELMLVEESEPIYVEIGSYEIKEENGKHYLIAKDINTSKKWINIIAKKYLENKKFKIPQNIAKTIKTVV